MDARLLPYAFARDFALLAHRIGTVDNTVEVWVSDATAPKAIAEVSRCFGRVRLKSMSREELEAAIAKAYAGSGGDAAQVIDEYESDLDLNKLMQDMPAVEDLLESADDAPVIRMINALLTQALREGASDIHIEPFEQISVVRFRIDGVTGPDEYSAVADNNVYTNLMAQRNLRLAADVVQRHADRASELGVDPEEAAAWRDAAQAILIPFDEQLGVHPQAEGFTEHQAWDFEHTAPEQYPLMLHFPYLELYRKQVVKQADLVLAMHLRGDAFSADHKARNFAYYEAITVRDSSLSACTQAVIAAEVGHLELAYDYFAEASLMDLEDLEHDTGDGLHIASLAGAWIVAVAGFGGMRDHDGSLSFMPRLPQRLTRLAFGVCFRERRLKVEITHEGARYSLPEGAPLEIAHHGETFNVTGERPVTRKIPAPSVPDAPRQPPGRAPARRRPAG